MALGAGQSDFLYAARALQMPAKYPKSPGLGRGEHSGSQAYLL